jgi:2-deoxy-D-gluconate 3-dehydrogenase
MKGTPGRRCSDEHLPGLAVQSENEILAYCREVGTTICHPSCSCRMGIDDRASFRASKCAVWKIFAWSTAPSCRPRLGQHQRRDRHDCREGLRHDPQGCAMNLFGLAGKVALVTGGNGGIGLGMAKGLAAAGASVVIAGRNAPKAKAALAELGPKAAFVRVEIAKPEACQAMVRETVERFGRLDILVNNAGVNDRKRPELYSPQEWHAIIEPNLSGAFFAAQAAYPAMKKAGRGKIINIGSMMSIFGASFAAPYAASKGGLTQLTKALATAWATDNIQVNAILPGWIDTDLTAQARKQVEGLNERVLARTPAGRWGKPGDFAGIAVFLASAASDFITGAAIPVDGGYSSQG